MSARFDPRTHEYEDRHRSAGIIYILLVVVAVAFGGFVWQLYTGPEVQRISADAGPYKSAPQPELATAPDSAEQSALGAALEGRDAPVEQAATPRAGPEMPILGPASAAAAPPAPTPPRFASGGGYLAQLAALQSEAAVETAWRRLESRAPDLFAQARLDVERADLGARGVYYRVRAGYFANREEASRFCERIRRMGQDCIVVAR